MFFVLLCREVAVGSDSSWWCTRSSRGDDSLFRLLGSGEGDLEDMSFEIKSGKSGKKVRLPIASLQQYSWTSDTRR